MGCIRLALIAVAVFGSAAAIAAETRIALVIGNSDYVSGPLPNPANDAKMISETLNKLGFEVIARRNADQNTMKRAIQEFGSRLEKAGPAAVGLFYYAGHGVQLNGRNYLIPTTAQIEREGDVEIEAVSADWVIEQMRYARNRLNIVILDACRNTPSRAACALSITAWRRWTRRQESSLRTRPLPVRLPPMARAGTAHTPKR